MFKNVLLFLFAISLTACSHKYRVDNVDAAKEQINFSSASFYIAESVDGKFENTNYANSGKMVSDAIEKVLLQAGASTVERANRPEGYEEALKNAGAKRSNFLFIPKIIHWEDRATEWSGRPDRITMSYAMYRVDTKEKIASMMVSASSKWATFGGDHPQDLVPQTVQQFIATMR